MRIHNFSKSKVKGAHNVPSWVLNGAMGCDEVRRGAIGVLIPIWKADGVVLQAHVSEERELVVSCTQTRGYLAYRESSCFRDLFGTASQEYTYSMSELLNKLEVTGRGQPKSRAYLSFKLESFKFETQQPRDESGWLVYPINVLCRLARGA